ncbi:hypothetical protein [Acidomonas methanolica]|uniref:hypothetical protein n=1 Tax=Acidomonas methanolica TaxID=437 RepID=UPI00211A9E61|nr:hypothetical protein [Acidomonas methanolica]MCQ9157241.1 hypothetical protein [Acidomonas methanolica]
MTDHQTTRQADRRLDDNDITFLARFARRGWLGAGRDDEAEEQVCQRAVQVGYLRRSRSEYQFTTAGREVLYNDQ